jgi:hypothetical protein
MTQETKSERRRRVARHVFEAMRAKFPEKKIVLVHPGDAARMPLLDVTDAMAKGEGDVQI